MKARAIGFSVAQASQEKNRNHVIVIIWLSFVAF